MPSCDWAIESLEGIFLVMGEPQLTTGGVILGLVVLGSVSKQAEHAIRNNSSSVAPVHEFLSCPSLMMNSDGETQAE